MNEDKIILTKEEYDDLCANYDKVYEQAKADILGNISDGGTSCHWCIDENRRIGKEEALKQVWHKTADGDWPISGEVVRVVLEWLGVMYYAQGVYTDGYGWTFADNPNVYAKVIAWTELPTYEGRIMNEELKNFSEVCAGDIDYAITSQEFSRDDRIEIGRALYNLGYRKIVWHDITDNDLPIKTGDYLTISKSGYYRVLKYCAEDFLGPYDEDYDFEKDDNMMNLKKGFNDFDDESCEYFITDSVCKWMEIPEQ